MMKLSSKLDTVNFGYFLIAISTTFFLLFIYLIQPSFLQFLNFKVTDLILASDNSPMSSDAVVIVDLDNESLSRYGQWPWPRYRLAGLLEKINQKGAISIGLDMILAEPDRTSPGNWRQDLEKETGYNVTLKGLPAKMLDYDAILAETLSKGPFVLGYKFLFDNENHTAHDCVLHPAGLIWIQNETSSIFFPSELFQARKVDCNLRRFSTAVSYSGFLNAAPDSDGLLRRIPLLIQYQHHYYPAFALATLMQAMQVTQLIVKTSESGQPYLLLQNKKIPVDRKGHMRFYFPDQKTPVITISAQDVLEDNVNIPDIQGKIVFIGSSASGLEHVSQTPGRLLTHEMEIHAFLVNSILKDRFVLENAGTLLWEIFTGICIAVLCAVFIARMGIFFSGILSLLMIFGIWQGTVYVFRSNNILFSPLFPVSVMFFEYSTLTIFKYWKGRRKAQKETMDTLVCLQTREIQLDSIIKAVPDIIFRLDRDGRIIFVSPAINKYNCTPDDLLGKRLLDMVDPDERSKAVFRVNERRTGQRSTKELELKIRLPFSESCNDPQWRYFCVSAEGIYETDATGQKTFLGTQGLLRDITEQKQMQDQLVQAKKLEAIGNLAAGVAHDLNNVLSGLVSYPELLLMDLPEDSPMRKILLSIQKSGQKAADIVQDMLTLSRRGMVTDTVLNLNQVVSDYLESSEYQTLMKNYPDIRLQTHLNSDLLNIKGSSIHFSKAVMNLIINAAEAMPSGGVISVFTDNVYFDSEVNAYEIIPEGDYVRLSIEDEGVGISPENQQHIFEPFFTKKTMGQSGTGLGMTIIWAAAKDHQGFIDVKSQEGEGTRLDIYLPVTRDIINEKSLQPVLQDYLGTEKILVVDDIQEQLQITRKMLGKLGYEIHCVSSGEAALEYLKTQTVDLLVLDMIMPSGMDGLETYQQILKLHPHQKAIITSGFSESKRVKQLQALGAGSFVQKPYTLEKIGMAIRKELDRNNQDREVE